MSLDFLKAEATAAYNKNGRYKVIFTNLFSDFLNQYDALIAKGYTKPHDFDISAYNGNLSTYQTIHMIKPDKVQEAELKAILALVEAQYKEASQ